jgi:hypothetical protein
MRTTSQIFVQNCLQSHRFFRGWIIVSISSSLQIDMAAPVEPDADEAAKHQHRFTVELEVREYCSLPYNDHEISQRVWKVRDVPCQSSIPPRSSRKGPAIRSHVYQVALFPLSCVAFLSCSRFYHGCSFLSYLQYFHKPRYARFVHYPQALHMLELLQEESFREAVRNEQVVAELLRKQLVHWATWRGGKGATKSLKSEDGNDPNG